MAKCAATNGENVQSSNRVGSPWCCASDSQSHTVGPGCSRCAYLRKLRIRWRSSRGESSPRRARLVRFEYEERASPRKTSDECARGRRSSPASASSTARLKSRHEVIVSVRITIWLPG